MSPIELIYLLGIEGVKKVARPIASAMTKGVNMHPTLQRFIAQTAKKNQKEEKEVIEKAAQHLVIYTIAGGALAYYQTRPSPYQEMIEEIQKNKQEWDELQQKWQKLYPELVREQQE